MANKLKRLKNGMGGSRCGRGRSESTADMKRYGKKLRRRVDKETTMIERAAMHDFWKFEKED